MMDLLYSVLLFLTVVLILLFYRYLTANYNYWKKRGVPSADGVVPGFGHLWPSFSMQKHFNIIEKEIYEAHTESMVGMMKDILKPSLLQTVRSTFFRFLPFLTKIFKVGVVPHWIDAKFTRIVGDLLKKRKNDGIERNDLLQNLIEICREKGLSDHTVISDTFSLFIEMFGTSSIVMSFLVCDLAQHLHIQKKLREEINAISSQYDGKISYEAVNEMTYLDQVLSESMRLNPIGFFQKICSEPTELKGSDGIKCSIKPGDRTIIPAYAIHRDPQHWENPEAFRPERFDKESEEFQMRHKYTYIPFGEGPRMCPGMRMAVLQMKILIAMIVRNFVIVKSAKLKEPVTLDPGHFFSYIKGGAWIGLKRL